MWIALINREPGRFEACASLVDRARTGAVEIWTSAFTYAEVYKRNCAGVTAAIAAADDRDFEDFLDQDFVQLVQVDADVGRAARRLLRGHPGIGKPQDAIHVASALLMDVPVLHTFDRKNLLSFDRRLHCQDGTALRIEWPGGP